MMDYTLLIVIDPEAGAFSAAEILSNTGYRHWNMKFKIEQRANK
jgi:hypothetical protein